MSSAITTMLEALDKAHPENGLSNESRSILSWIRQYNNELEQKYKENRQQNKDRIPFGKYKNNSIDAVLGMEKGSDYLAWLLRQSWFAQDNWSDLRGAIQEKLKKKH